MKNWINNKIAAMQAAIPAREEGQGVVEYALVLGVLVVAIYVAFVTTNIVGGVTNAVNAIVAELP